MTKGHNNPPNDFEISKKEIDDLYDEAKLWLDGEPIATQGQADQITKLLAKIKAAAKTADTNRKYECQPHDDAKKAIQEKYAPLIADTKGTTGKTALASSVCKEVILPWNKKVQAEKDEAARKARAIAEAKEREAQEAIRASDLEGREEAEKLLKEANKAAAKAKSISKDNVKGMRTVWDVVVGDRGVLMSHYWETRRDDLCEYVKGLAESEVRSGVRKIAGCTITSRKVVK